MGSSVVAVFGRLPWPGEPPGVVPGGSLVASMSALVTASGQHVWSGYAEPRPRWSRGDEGGSPCARPYSGRGDGGIATGLPGGEVEGRPALFARASSTGNEEEGVPAGEVARLHRLPPPPVEEGRSSSSYGAFLAGKHSRNETGEEAAAAVGLLHHTPPEEAQMLAGLHRTAVEGEEEEACAGKEAESALSDFVSSFYLCCLRCTEMFLYCVICKETSGLIRIKDPFVHASFLLICKPDFNSQ